MRRWAFHKYAWVLGAGASKFIGIPLGMSWLTAGLPSCMPRVRRQGEVQGSQGLGYPENLGRIDPPVQMGRACQFLPHIFQRRFSEYRLKGTLIGKCDCRETPARLSILCRGAFWPGCRPNNAAPHNVRHHDNSHWLGCPVDLYGHFSAIAGHESLAAFCWRLTYQALICKIHRDLFSHRRMTAVLETIERCTGE